MKKHAASASAVIFTGTKALTPSVKGDSQSR